MDRLSSAFQVSALCRKIAEQGGFATVLAKGDATSGAILLVQLHKGEIAGLWERILTASGVYQWSKVHTQNIDGIEGFDLYISKKRANDPDLWVVELDIADGAQLTALLAVVG